MIVKKSLQIIVWISFIELMAFNLSLEAKENTDSRNFIVEASTQVKNSQKQRVALVIGNSAYGSSPLANPVNDAKDMSAKLQTLGFQVIERDNISMQQIGSTLSEFRSKLTAGAVALVFYAGHGIQIKDENYLPTVDAQINTEEDVPNQSISVKQIMDILEDSKTRLNLVFLDACRNNPYSRSFRSASRGLARVIAPSGTLISYATRPGSVASDGDGRNGLYTSKLLKQMDSTQPIEQSLKRVVSEVKAESKGKQAPWIEGSIEGDFCFAGCDASAPIMPVVNTVDEQITEETPPPEPVAVPSSSATEANQGGQSIGNISGHKNTIINEMKGNLSINN